jgi:hypothetical protein
MCTSPRSETRTEREKKMKGGGEEGRVNTRDGEGKRAAAKRGWAREK